jgi:hypothetical protein
MKSMALYLSKTLVWGLPVPGTVPTQNMLMIGHRCMRSRVSHSTKPKCFGHGQTTI